MDKKLRNTTLRSTPVSRGAQRAALTYILHGPHLWVELRCMRPAKGWIVILCQSSGGFLLLRTFPLCVYVLWTNMNLDTTAKGCFSFKPYTTSPLYDNFKNVRRECWPAGVLKTWFGPLWRTFGCPCSTGMKTKLRSCALFCSYNVTNPGVLHYAHDEGMQWEVSAAASCWRN